MSTLPSSREQTVLEKILKLIKFVSTLSQAPAPVPTVEAIGQVPERVIPQDPVPETSMEVGQAPELVRPQDPVPENSMEVELNAHIPEHERYNVFLFTFLFHGPL